MNTIFKNKPVYKNNSLYTALLYFLSIITSAISMMPVTVAFMSRFTQLETNADILFVILKGLFAVSLLIAVNAIAIYKDVIFGTIPAFFAALTAVIPMVQSIKAFTDAKAFADKYQMSIDLSPYVLTMVEYLIFFLLAVFTFLYLTGWLRLPAAILALSVSGAIAAQYSVIVNATTYEIPIYEVLCFAYTVVACLIPAVIVLGCWIPGKLRLVNYRAKRYEK